MLAVICIYLNLCCSKAVSSIERCIMEGLPGSASPTTRTFIYRDSQIRKLKLNASQTDACKKILSMVDITCLLIFKLYFFQNLNAFAGHLISTSSPGPSPRSKWQSEKPLAKAAEILQESWSILSRDTR